MLRKNKYDILSKKMLDNSKKVFSFSIKMTALRGQLIRNKIDEDEMEEEISKLIYEMMPYLVSVSHFGYETSKDLATIDKDVLFKYLESKGISKVQFSFNYSKNLKNAITYLTLFAIAEKDNINLFDLDDPILALQLLAGEGLEEIVEEAFDKLSEESEDLLDEILDDDFNYANMSEELKKLVEEYHNNYMEKNVYPSVTEENISEKQIMKMVKSFGKGKK